MEKRQLGQSQIQVSPMAFGAWAIGGWMWGGAEASDAIEAIHVALDAGITTIDTAPVYGFGKSETLVAKALEGQQRDSYQLLTKFGLNCQDDRGEFYFDTTDDTGKPLKVYRYAAKQKIIQECEDSLRRLRTDYIDLYQIHWPDNTTPISETFEAVDMLIRQGKVRAAGVCNYNIEQTATALETIPLVSNQVPYSLVFRDIEQTVVPQALQAGMSIIAYSPLQRGLLTGKIKPGHKFAPGDTRAANRFYTDENIQRVNAILEELEPIAAAHGATLAQLIINWTMHQPGIGCVLVGARNAAQVKDNVGALGFSLGEDTLQEITRISDKFVAAPAG